MRKITEQACQAFHNGNKFNSGNTLVVNDFGVTKFFLHGNMIAKHSYEEGLFVSTCGWNTPTTKERLNGIEGVSVYTKKGQLYLNDKAWDGELVNVYKWSN